VQVSVRDEEDVLRAVQSVHAMIDREIAAGTNPQDVFVFGLSQGGALGIASVLLHPKTLGGCAVFSGFLPFNSSFAVRVTAQAKKVMVGSHRCSYCLISQNDLLKNKKLIYR
jgi:lysophospholipase-2